MTNDIHTIRKRAGLTRMTESAQSEYMKMFDVILNIQTDNQVIKDALPAIKDSINTAVKHIRTKFQRKDIVVWFLHRYRVSFTAALYQKVPEYKEVFEKVLKSFMNIYGTDLKASIAEGNHYSNFMRLQHYFDLNIDEINNYRFERKLYADIMEDFNRIEKEWQKKYQDQGIPVDDVEGAEVLIDFPNGWAWWNLNKSGCDLEGRAMGHCGNGVGNEDENVLSLRQEVTRGGKSYHMPHLTFIVDVDGNLGEMKGRGNKKPTQKYHPYILALLRSNFINRVDGGGYLPDENFSLFDLDQDILNDLLEKKPNLMNLKDQYQYAGFKVTQDITDQVEQTLREEGLTPNTLYYDINQDKYCIGDFDNVRDFLSVLEDDPELNKVIGMNLSEVRSAIVDALYDFDYHVIRDITKHYLTDDQRTTLGENQKRAKVWFGNIESNRKAPSVLVLADLLTKDATHHKKYILSLIQTIRWEFGIQVQVSKGRIRLLVNPEELIGIAFAMGQRTLEDEDYGGIASQLMMHGNLYQTNPSITRNERRIPREIDSYTLLYGNIFRTTEDEHDVSNMMIPSDIMQGLIENLMEYLTGEKIGESLEIQKIQKRAGIHG